MNEKRLTPVKAIRAKCLECSVGNVAEVRNCVIPTCPLYPYRMGHNPARAGLGKKNPAFFQSKDSTEDFESEETSEGSYIPEE